MRILLVLIGLIGLTACGGIRDDLATSPDAVGTFRLGHNIAVVNDPVRGPFSRRATNEDWQAAMVTAVGDRLGEERYFGGKFFHVGVAVEAYVLAQPGIPLVYAPRSVMIFTVNFFEDSPARKLNEDPIQITVFEPCCAIPFVGTGYTRSAQMQMEGLSFNAARAIERSMRQNADWFGGTPEVLEADDTILEGNILVDNPELVAPQEVLPEDFIGPQFVLPADVIAPQEEVVTALIGPQADTASELVPITNPPGTIGLP